MKNKYFICLFISVVQTSLALFKPSFTSKWYTIKSVAGNESEVTIYHNLNVLPVKVAAEVRVVNTQTGDSIIFPGMGSANTDDDFYTKYGGVLVLYNDTRVRLIVPGISSTGSIYGKVIYTGHEGWAGPFNVNTSYMTGDVRVKVWTADDLPTPDFETSWEQIGVYDSKTFKEIPHGMSGYPSMAVVQINASKTIFEGQGSSSKLEATDYYIEAGGVVFGYSATHFRLWYPTYSGSHPYVRVLSIIDGWGKQETDIRSSYGTFRILAWKFPDSWVETTEVSVDSIKWNNYQIQHGSENFELMNVEVHALDGDNAGFRFYGVGSAVNDGLAGSGKYGGLVYGYNGNTYNFWKPKNSAAIVSVGHLLHIGGFWGSNAQTHFQSSDNVVVRINTITLYRDSYYNVVSQNSGLEPQNDIVWTVKTDSVLTCAIDCSNSLECRSFFYHKKDKRCLGYRYTSLQSLSNIYPGFQHYSDSEDLGQQGQVGIGK